MDTLEKITTSQWHAEEKLLETILSGDVDEEDVIRWETSLEKALSEIPADSTFKCLVNLHGFTAINIHAHKRYRTIIPLTLAKYNWKVGYVDLFDEASQLTFSKNRNIQCVAAVHVHQDETKISKYEEKFSRENEHFMTDPDKAKAWILHYKI